MSVAVTDGRGRGALIGHSEGQNVSPGLGLATALILP